MHATKSTRLLGAKRRRYLMYFLFLLPALVVFILFKYYPIVLAAFLGFQKLTLSGGEWIGLYNYERFLQDREAHHALWVTVQAMVTGVVVGTPLAFFLALLLSASVKGKNIFRTAFFIPYITPVIATAYVWKVLFSSDFGTIALIMNALFGSSPAFLADTRLALYVIVFYGIWKGIGYTMLIYLAALEGLDPTLYDAARIDGANFLSYLWRIIVPMLNPITWMLIILGVIGGLKSFTHALLLTGGGPKDATMFYGLYVYYRAFWSFDYGYAAALGTILLVVIVAMTMLQIRRMRMEVS